MAKKSNKMKIMKLRQSQTEAFLLRSGIPVKDIKQLTRDIQELVEVGGQSMPEAHQQAIEEWKDNSFLEISRKIAIENAKTEAENQKRYNAALKSAARDAKEAARLAKAAEKAEAKAAAKAVKDAAKAKPKPTPPIPPVPPPPVPDAEPDGPTEMPPPVPDAEPDGPTEMPPPIPDEPREKSGIRKAFEASLEEEDRKYLDTLETLRRGAAKTIQDNKELFGTYRNQTLDQSTMFKLYEGVVELGEAAAKAKTSEEKQRIFSKLKAYKKIVKNLLIEGNDSEKEVAKELEKIISNIEKQVSTKRFGSETIGLEVARISENLMESMRRIPEKLVSKIPIIGGFLSGVLERKRERKQGEKDTAADLASDISRGTGGRNLFSKTGQDEEMSPAEIEGISTGGSEIDDTESGESTPDTTGTPPIIPPAGTAGIANGQTIQTLKSILIQVVEIKSLIQGQVNTEEGVDAAEAETEAADAQADFMEQLRRLLGGSGIETGDKDLKHAKHISEGGEGAGGMLQDFMKSGMMQMLGGMVAPLASVALPVIGVIAAAAGGYMVGKALFDNWLSPLMDEQQEKRNAALAEKPVSHTSDVVTDKGEKVYAVGDAASNSVMSESEINAELADKKTTSLRKSQLQSALETGPEKQLHNDITGTIVGGRTDLVSGASIETMRSSELAVERAAQNDPKGTVYQKLYDQIATWDETTRQDWEKKKTLGDKVDLFTVAKKYKAEAAPLWKQIDAKANGFSTEQKEKLHSLSPLLEELGERGNLGEIEGAVGIDDMNKWAERKKTSTLLGFEITAGQNEDVATRLDQIRSAQAAPEIAAVSPSAAGAVSPSAAGTVAPSAAAGTPTTPQLLKFVAGPRDAMGNVLGKDGKILPYEEYNKKLKELGLSRTNSSNSLDHARSKDVLNWRASQVPTKTITPSAAVGTPSAAAGAVAPSATGKVSSDAQIRRQFASGAGVMGMKLGIDFKKDTPPWADAIDNTIKTGEFFDVGNDETVVKWIESTIPSVAESKSGSSKDDARKELKLFAWQWTEAYQKGMAVATSGSNIDAIEAEEASHYAEAKELLGWKDLKKADTDPALRHEIKKKAHDIAMEANPDLWGVGEKSDRAAKLAGTPSAATGAVAPSAAAGAVAPSAASTPSTAATGTVAPSAAAGAKPQLLKFVAGPRDAMGNVLGKDGKILPYEEYNKKLKELGLSRTNSSNSLDHARSKDVLNWRASQQISDSGLSAEIAQERADTDIAAQKASQPVAPSAATGAVAPSAATGTIVPKKYGDEISEDAIQSQMQAAKTELGWGNLSDEKIKSSKALTYSVRKKAKELAAEGDDGIGSDIDNIRQQVIDAGMDPNKPHMFVGGGNGKSKILMLDDHVTAADPSRQAEADAIAKFRNSFNNMGSKPITGKIETPTTPNTDVGKQTLQLDKSRTDLENQQLPNTSSGSINTVVAPKTSNSSTVINNNSGGAGTRNNESTLQRAERGSVI